MWEKNGFFSYRDEVVIGDGSCGITTTARTIVCQEDNGRRQILKVGMYRGYKAIVEWKVLCGRKVEEWVKHGAFHRWQTPRGMAVMRFHPASKKRKHGYTERPDCTLLGYPVVCKTRYGNGRFISQECWYTGLRRRAYFFHRKDTRVTITRPDGRVASTIEAPGGFRQPSDGGHPLFLQPDQAYNRNDQFAYSRDGNSTFVVRDIADRVLHSGSYTNGKRTGEWVINRQPVYFFSGVPVSKKLWDTPPEKLDVSVVLRLKNAQIRAALLKRIGGERLARESKYAVIHHDRKRGNRLLQFPITVSDGNGGTTSKLRFLQVTCPSTKHLYYLSVPDFVWDGGKKTRLDTCEQARQWTFGVDNPRERVQFALET